MEAPGSSVLDFIWSHSISLVFLFYSPRCVQNGSVSCVPSGGGSGRTECAECALRMPGKRGRSAAPSVLGYKPDLRAPEAPAHAYLVSEIHHARAWVLPYISGLRECPSLSLSISLSLTDLPGSRCPQAFSLAKSLTNGRGQTVWPRISSL